MEFFSKGGDPNKELSGALLAHCLLWARVFFLFQARYLAAMANGNYILSLAQAHKSVLIKVSKGTYRSCANRRPVVGAISISRMAHRVALVCTFSPYQTQR